MSPLRGLRPWHVGHSEYAATREVLCYLAGSEYAGQLIIKGGRQKWQRKSDGVIVPEKAGNAAGGKDAT